MKSENRISKQKLSKSNKQCSEQEERVCVLEKPEAKSQKIVAIKSVNCECITDSEVSDLKSLGNYLTEQINLILAIGFEEVASYSGVHILEYRKQLNEQINSYLGERNKEDALKDTVDVAFYWSYFDWSNHKDWYPKYVSGYKEPKIIQRISDLLYLFTCELTCLEYGSNPQDRIEGLVMKYLDILEKEVNYALKDEMDDHKCIHIYENVTTFNMTLIQSIEALCGYPEKMDDETRPQETEFYCHPLLGGLTVSEYIFEAKKKRASQKPRSPSNKTNRSGQGVSFEELANIYRTSRVTLANVFNRTMFDLRKSLIESVGDISDMYDKYN